MSFEDEDHTTWLFDLRFLTSDWSCTFGSGCLGTEPEDNGARGCCAHGAHLVDDAEREELIDAAARLTDEQWQNRSFVTSEEDLFDDTDDNDTVTRRIDDACIFLNDEHFGGGHGCALHIGAVSNDERPMDWKPAVCWQVPFRLEEFTDASGTRTVVVRAWRRSDWGAGGSEFGWFCTDSLTPATMGNETYARHLDELVELVGEWPVAMLTDYLTQRTRAVPVSLEPRPPVINE